MWPDRVSNPAPLALELDALCTALHGSADFFFFFTFVGVNSALASYGKKSFKVIKTTG